MSDDPIANHIANCATGDRAAFRALYRDSSAKLMGVLLRRLGERSEAEDALQEVYTRVWTRAGRFDATKGRGMTWLIAIARNLAIDRLRSRPAPTSDDGLDLIQDTAPRAVPQFTKNDLRQHFRQSGSGTVTPHRPRQCHQHAGFFDRPVDFHSELSRLGA
jgi:RNA polymerase sigma factor (sigma-70 family)